MGDPSRMFRRSDKREAPRPLERVERIATISMAFLGFVAFGWQIQEQRRSRSEVLTVEAEDPNFTSDGSIQLMMTVINRGDRTVYVRGVRLAHHPRNRNGATEIAFNPDSLVKLEAGQPHRFSSRALGVSEALQIQSERALIARVRTTRERFSLPIRYSFSAPTLNTITKAAGRPPETRSLPPSIFNALQRRIAVECANPQTVGLWRDADGTYWAGGAASAGQATATICP